MNYKRLLPVSLELSSFEGHIYIHIYIEDMYWQRSILDTSSGAERFMWVTIMCTYNFHNKHWFVSLRLPFPLLLFLGHELSGIVASVSIIIIFSRINILTKKHYWHTHTFWVAGTKNVGTFTDWPCDQSMMGQYTYYTSTEEPRKWSIMVML